MAGTPDEPSGYDPSSVGSDQDMDRKHDAGVMIQNVKKMDDPEALLYEHPDYVNYKHKWQKYIDCYLKTDIYRFIHQHPREHQDDFQMRVKRGYFFNYVESIVDLYVAYLFEGGVTRDPDKELSDEYQLLYDNADLGETGYQVFMQTAATFAICMGHVGILVDMPRVDEELQSRADEKAMGIRPYLTMVHPKQILDWEIDDKGKFEWVKIEISRPQGRDWKTTLDVDSRHFVIWKKDGWERWVYRTKLTGPLEGRPAGAEPETEAVRDDFGEHSLGEVPLVILKNERDLGHEWFGDSAVRDIVDINLAILNWCSFADEEVANRCLNILTAQRDDTDRPVEISHHNVIEYADGANPPDYLTPGETPLKLIWEAVSKARDEIYRLAKLSGSTGLLGVREATSGVAYAFEFNETNQSLCKKAEFLEQAEKEIHRLFAKWLTKEFNGTITYPREFGVDDFLVELQILAEGRTTLTSETAIKELEKRVITKLFAKSRQQLREKMKSEVDRANWGLVPMTMQPLNFESFKTVPAELTGGPSSAPTAKPGGQPPAPTAGPEK